MHFYSLFFLFFSRFSVEKCNSNEHFVFIFITKTSPTLNPELPICIPIHVHEGLKRARQKWHDLLNASWRQRSRSPSVSQIGVSKENAWHVRYPDMNNSGMVPSYSSHFKRSSCIRGWNTSNSSRKSVIQEKGEDMQHTRCLAMTSDNIAPSWRSQDHLYISKTVLTNNLCLNPVPLFHLPSE